ncbi:MAG TPA: hypothetical protein PK340_05075 [Bacilli bacterium]|jgi:hypothetical protein|nr:hypothetical protein [Bacilli bacterium]
MKLFDRLIVLFMTLFWFVVAVFFWRFYWMAILPALALVFVMIGGRRHV